MPYVFPSNGQVVSGILPLTFKRLLPNDNLRAKESIIGTPPFYLGEYWSDGNNYTYGFGYVSASDAVPRVAHAYAINPFTSSISFPWNMHCILAWEDQICKLNALRNTLQAAMLWKPERFTNSSGDNSLDAQNIINLIRTFAGLVSSFSRMGI